MTETRLQRLYGPVRRLLPPTFADWVRRLATAFLTPINFSLATGHFRSALARKAVSRCGVPLPWYTYPAIDFVAANDFHARTVLEFGGGQSTLWWAARADQILTYESDPDWFQSLQKQVPSNARVIQCRSDLSDFVAPTVKFDVVVVDGCNRFFAAREGVALLKPDGAMIVDDTEGYWGPEETFPILELMRSLGFQRVDFFGYSPGVVKPHCTSVFFRHGSFLFAGTANPRDTLLSSAPPLSRPK